MNNNQKFYINLFGPLCSGKTTVAKLLHKQLPRTVMISNDKLKWFISDYRSEEDRPIISLMVFDIVKRAFEAGFSVIRDANLHKETPAQLEMYDKLFKENDVKLLEFALEASVPTLLDRLRKRVDRAERENVQIVVKTEKLFMKHYDEYMKSKRQVKTFDTEKLTSNEIAENILLSLKNA